MEISVLIVDDEVEMCLSLSELLTSEGYHTSYAVDPRQVQSILSSDHIDLIIMDVKMPYMSGLDLLKTVKGDGYPIPIIMITGYPSIENTVLAMRYGALNFYTKPLKIKELLKEIQQFFSSADKQCENVILDKITINTKNPKMVRLIENMKKVAKTDVPVIIMGESGTGKEHAANILHRFSKRRDQPFIKVNCAAIPDNLLESELFGHEKGAFTDAIYSRKGKFELSSGGSIFLDEIGDMSLNTQAKILRVLEEKRFERLGSNRELTTDTRVISATNKNLCQLRDEGRFREDLFYRLSVVTIELMPLRERREDIMLLTHHFLSHYNKIYGKSIRSVSDEVKQIFINHDWPGNVRELMNCVQRAVIFCEEEIIQKDHLSAQYGSVSVALPSQDFQEQHDILSREIITDALEKTKGNRKKAAELLKIHRKTLYNRMKKLGMQ